MCYPANASPTFISGFIPAIWVVCTRLDWSRSQDASRNNTKLENGKYFVPTIIEEALGILSRFISQVVVCEANCPPNIALIVPEWSAIRDELDGAKGHLAEEDLANDTRVQDLITNETCDFCYKLKKFEIPTKRPCVAPFTAANSQMMPKRSIRRHTVMEAYKHLISHLYGDDPVVTQAADGVHRKAAERHLSMRTGRG